MKNPMASLGLLLLTILLLILAGSFVFFLANDSNNMIALGLGFILLFVVLTFLAYLLFDLYRSDEDRT